MHKEPENTTSTTNEPANAKGCTYLNELSERLRPLVTQLNDAKSKCLSDVGAAINLAAEVGLVLHEAQQIDLPGFSLSVWAEDHGLVARDINHYIVVGQKFRKAKLTDIPLRTALVTLELLPETCGRSTPPDDRKTPTFQIHINRLAQALSADRVKELEPWVKNNIVKQLLELIARLEG